MIKTKFNAFATLNRYHEYNLTGLPRLASPRLGGINSASAKWGFTLIELLVVIVIIGIIATLATIAISQARAKARDAERISDIKQVSTALELYRADEGSYPTVITPGQPLAGPTSGVTYMKKIPNNPVPTDDGICAVNEYTHVTVNGGQSYQITYCLGKAVSEASAGYNLAKPYVIAESCAFSCTNKCTGESDGCGGTCANAVVAYEGGPYDSNGTSTSTGGYYRTVLIGTQCWLKDNLNVGTMIGSKLADNTTVQNQTNNSVIEKYCYTYVQQDNAGQITSGAADCAVYGAFYQWPEAVQYSNSVTLTTGTAVAGGNIQGICPTGWHVPSDTEFTTLSTYLGGDTVAGGAMKETGLVHWNSPNTGSTNSSGFTGLGAGDRSTNGSFYSRGNYGTFWSTVPVGSNEAWDRYLSYNSATLNRYNVNRAIGFSVRCLKD